MSTKRIVVTGMSVNTPLGDTLERFRDGLFAGRSALSNWKKFPTHHIYSKVGADLSGYDVKAKLASFEGRVSPDMFRRLRKLVTRAPWSTKLSLLLTVDAWLDAGLVGVEVDPTLTGVMVAGHNINSHYSDENRDQFREEPDYIDPWLALHALDTDHAS
ncbi:MAG TPA: beta-ketoacyl synthase N-terminal-like domain-containing protein, partial [Polyangiaceae bacterium]|nr:beta-ketoacyl synthase N-terminal-like domain-containing protein [Polyangiaceae bacterium]